MPELMEKPETFAESQPAPKKVSRRQLLMTLGIALNAVADLLGRYRRHPKRQAGLIPVIRLESGTYPSKKFGGFKPKPLFVVVGWVTKDGNPPPPPLSTEMNDSLDF